jgi:type IV pilus assembly protein PilB
MHGKGCDQCRNSGYSGRCGIHELLIVDDEFRRIINIDASVNSMRDAFRKSGWPDLFQDGLIKVKKGITTIEEILRVAEVADAAEMAQAAEAVGASAHEASTAAQVYQLA